MTIITANPAVMNGKAFTPSNVRRVPELLPVEAVIEFPGMLLELLLLAAVVENPENVEPDKLAKYDAAEAYNCSLEYV